MANLVNFLFSVVASAKGFRAGNRTRSLGWWLEFSHIISECFRVTHIGRLRGELAPNIVV